MARVPVTALAVTIALITAACERKPAPPAPAGERLYSVEQVMQGARLYQEHCAQCHGPEAQGHPDWQTPGVVAAPPLDASGHAPRRSAAALAAAIRDGVARDGVPVMPGWKGRLADADIEAVISWFQALWPPEVYQQWRQLAASGGPRP